jgi:hypothetical protein
VADAVYYHIAGLGSKMAYKLDALAVVLPNAIQLPDETQSSTLSCQKQ